MMVGWWLEKEKIGHASVRFDRLRGGHVRRREDLTGWRERGPTGEQRRKDRWRKGKIDRQVRWMEEGPGGR
jgi:hypothetical protein